jgi:hypothetical protein
VPGGFRPRARGSFARYTDKGREEKMKTKILTAFAALMLGCEPANNDNETSPLPNGLFKTRSKVQVSQVDSQGFQKNWIDTASFYIKISNGTDWEQIESIEDTCVYWRAVSKFKFIRDTVYLTDTHGTSYNTSSAKCQQIDHEYDLDSTFKIGIKAFSDEHIDINGVELFFEKIFRYDRVKP